MRSEDLDELARRMDVVPPSIVLAVASEEAGEETARSAGEKPEGGAMEKSVSTARNTAGWFAQQARIARDGEQGAA